MLGQTWVGHYGRNHQQSTRITIIDDRKNHPILRGVKDVWVQAGGYVGKPIDGEILTMAQPLNGMKPDVARRCDEAADAFRMDAHVQVRVREDRGECSLRSTARRKTF